MDKSTITPLSFEDIMYMQEQVVEWNRLFGINPEDSEYAPLYKSLTEEEYGGKDEFLESWNKGDHEGILDGLIDLMFVTGQWATLKGTSLTKRDEGWVQSIYRMKVQDEVTISRLGRYINEDKSGAALDNLIKLLVKTSSTYNIRAAFDRVCESNYSKAVHKDKNVDIQAEIDYIISKGRYAGITAEESGDYIIFKACIDVESGVVFDKPKVIKSRQFVDVSDLGGLLEFKY